MKNNYSFFLKNTISPSKPSKAICLLLMVLFVCSFANVASAQTKTWDGSSNSNWNTANNWTPSGVPTATDDVIIPNGITGTITVNTAAVCKSFTMNGGGTSNTVTISGSNSLTVFGAVNIGAGSGNGDNKILAVNAGNLSCTTITMAATSATNRNSRLTLSTGTITASSNVDLNSTNTNNAIIFSSTGLLKVGGNMSGGTLTPSTGTVEYYGNGTQAVGIYTYYNLTTSGSGNKNSSTSAFVVQNNLTVNQGNLVLAATDANYTVGNNLTVAAAGTLTHSVAWNAYAKLLLVSGNLDIAGAYSYSGAYTGIESPRAHIHMNGTSKTIKTGTAALSILTIAGTISANGSVIVNDNLWAPYNTAGTFATAGNNVTANGALLVSGGTLLINGGTLNVSGGLYNTFSGFDGVIDLSSGILNADFLNVGNGAGTVIGTGTNKGTFNHSGGTANIGDFVIGGGTAANAYICTGTPTINISGSWTNNKTFTAASSTVNFTGTSPQTINGNLSGINGKFYNLTFNGVGGSWTNTAPIEVASKLTMANGILNTTAPTNIINITNTATTASTAGTATSFVSGPVKWATTLATAYTFPVGKGTTYLPFVLNNVTAPTGTPTAQAEAFDSNCGGTADLSTIGTLSTSEYWSLVTAGTFTNSSVSLSRPTAIAPLDIIGGSTVANGSGANAYKSLAGTAGTNGITNSSPIGTNRFFAFGRHEIRTSAITGSPFCIGSTGAAVSVPFTIAGTYNSGNVFTAQLSNASGSFASPVNIGTVIQTTAGTITATIPSGTAAGTGYRIRVVSSNPSVTGQDNGTSLTISNTAAPTGTASQSFCSGATVANLVATGAGIKWYAASSGGTALSTSTVLTNGTHYYASQTVSGCESTSRFDVTATVSPATVAGTVSADQSICTNSFPADITLTGSTGTIQWQSSTDNSTFNDISSNGTGSTLYSWAMGPLTSTRYYRAVVKSGSCSSVTSAVVTVAVSPAAVVGTVSANQSICTNSSPADITLTGSTGTIQWQSSTDNSTFNDISGATASTLLSTTMGPLTSARYYRAVVKSGSCSSVTSAVVTVSVSPATVAGTLTLTAGNANACSSGNYTAFTLTGYTGSIIRWESSTDNFATAGTPIANLNNSYGVNNLTIDTYFRAVVQSGGCGVVYSNSIKVTIYGAMPATGAISLNGVAYPLNGNTSYCANTTAVFSIAPVVNASSYTWVIPSGWSVISGQGTTTLTATTGNTSANIEVYATNLGCPQANQSYLYLNLGNSPSTPTIGTITQPTCAIPTGSFTITNHVSSYTYSLTPSTGVVISGNTVTAPAGTYTITATSGSCSSTTPSNVVINNPPDTKTWNGANWLLDNGSITTNPTIENRIIFTGNYNSSSNLDACSCQVTSNAQVVINSVHTLTVTNSVDVVSGSLTFENNASLVQTKDAGENVNTNSGNIIYKRHTNYVRRYDYTYWSSPVEGQTLYNLSSLTLGDKYHGFDPNINNWTTYYNGNYTMLKGEGYIIRAPQTFDITTPAIDPNPVFIGRPNNGVITKTLDAGKLYLLGNPYPSALDADQFLFDNKDVLEGTLYFWTHITAIQLASNITNGTAGSGVYAYTSDDYASYNRTGGVGGAPAPSDTTPGKVSTPTGKIAAGQGFFAAAKDGGKLIFNNGMRVSGVSGNNSQFFKLPNSKTTATTIEKNRVWLNFTNKEGAFKQTLVGYITGATNDYDNGFDGASFDGNEFVDFYSVNQGANLSIQGRALPFVKKDSVALGYRTKIKGEFQISIDTMDGVLASQNVFVEDQDLKVLHNLKKTPYTFSTEAGTFNNRFILRYVDKNAVEEVIVPEAGKEVIISVQNGKIKINSPVELIDKVVVYNVAGRKIYQKNKVVNNELVIEHLISSHQVLLVDILLSNNTKISRKIVY